MCVVVYCEAVGWNEVWLIQPHQTSRHYDMMYNYPFATYHTVAFLSLRARLFLYPHEGQLETVRENLQSDCGYKKVGIGAQNTKASK